jgi:hypothetical protein
MSKAEAGESGGLAKEKAVLVGGHGDPPYGNVEKEDFGRVGHRADQESLSPPPQTNKAFLMSDWFMVGPKYRAVFTHERKAGKD